MILVVGRCNASFFLIQLPLARNSIRKMCGKKVIQAEAPTRTPRCLACGADGLKPRRRYCSKECRQQIDWVLSLSKGLLRTLDARYAVFLFTPRHVILDVLPVWSKGISRFIHRRAAGNKPAEDLKNLILESGKEWHRMVGNRSSRSFATLCLIQKNHKKDVNPDTVKPNRKTSPRLSRSEQQYLKILNVDKKELLSGCHLIKIKSAYKKMAKVHHPDKGGDAEKFKQLNEAHEKMILWAENPQFTSRRALRDCWSYDGSTNRWAPPL